MLLFTLTLLLFTDSNVLQYQHSSCYICFSYMDYCYPLCTSVTRRSTHTHTNASSTPSTREISHSTLSYLVHRLPLVSPAPVAAHSSSQVVHCRVYPPHPLHAPVVVLHLAVYPVSATQGRVGLTDRLPHCAQTHCNLTR